MKKLKGRVRIHKRIRKKIAGTAERPRLSVFRSNKHIYAQVINDEQGVTLAAASSKDAALAEVQGTKKEIAFKVGELLAKRANEASIKKVIFDRSGYLYHGRVAQLAEGARGRDEAGNCTLLQF